MNKEQFKEILSGFVAERLVDALAEQAKQKGYFINDNANLANKGHRAKTSERNFKEFKVKIKEAMGNFSETPDKPLNFVDVLQNDGTIEDLMKQQAKIRKEIQNSTFPPIEYASGTEFKNMGEYEKRAFVRKYLEPLIRKADFSVESVVYTSDNGEYVTIRYRQSKNEIRVCVGGDSLAALTRDVMKKI